MTTRLIGYLICVCSLLVATAVTSAAVDYRVRDLGGFSAAYACAEDINDNGQVVCVDFAEGYTYIWQGGVMQDMIGAVYPYPTTSGYAINSSGQVVGNASAQAFVWKGGSHIQLLGGLAPGNSDASDINSDGDVAGSSCTPQGTYHAVLWHNSAIRDIGTLGGLYSGAYGINDAGCVVGASTLTNVSGSPYHAFSWVDGGLMQDLGTLGGPQSCALSVNNAGQIVGWADLGDGSGCFHACVWQGGHILDIGALAGDVSSAACGINASGQIVGTSCAAGDKSRGRAFVYESGTMQELPMLQGYTYSDAYTLNSSGVIVGCCTDATGHSHAVIWEPVPEPSCVFGLLCGLSGLGGIVLRRRNC